MELKKAFKLEGNECKHFHLISFLHANNSYFTLYKTSKFRRSFSSTLCLLDLFSRLSKFSMHDEKKNEKKKKPFSKLAKSEQ